MELPNRIEPCPIIEAVIELRFLSNEPDDAIFGLIHKEIKSEFELDTKLPILDLPEQIRRQESSLRFKPYYKFKNDEYNLNIGPRVLSLIKKEPYRGWGEFSSDAIDIFQKVSNLNIVNEIVRLGLRYINFFDGNIYDQVDLDLTLGNESFIKEDTFIKNTYHKSGHDVTLQLGNNSTMKNAKGIRHGSILDVDVHLEDLPIEFLVDSEQVLGRIHRVEKETFFNLLKDSFVKELNPQYSKS